MSDSLTHLLLSPLYLAGFVLAAATAAATLDDWRNSRRSSRILPPDNRGALAALRPSGLRAACVSARPVLAHVNATGVLRFAAHCPAGHISILPELAGSQHYATTIRHFCAAHPADSRTLLVPGLLENPGSQDALVRFCRHVNYYVRKSETPHPPPGLTLTSPNL